MILELRFREKRGRLRCEWVGGQEVGRVMWEVGSEQGWAEKRRNPDQGAVKPDPSQATQEPRASPFSFPESSSVK